MAALVTGVAATAFVAESGHGHSSAARLSAASAALKPAPPKPAPPMLYWLTGTVNSSVRMYWEHYHEPGGRVPKPSATPTGVALFPHEIMSPVRALAEQANNIVRWSPQPRGGHFAALEEPGLLVDDIRAFFRPLRRPGRR